MKKQVRYFTIIIFVAFSYRVSFSQILKKGMTKEEVTKIWGKPRSIEGGKYYLNAKDKVGKVEYRWKYGKDTTLTFRDNKLYYINYPFNNYYKRLYQEKTNDTLKYCSLYVFFYDTIQNKYISTKPGIGTFNLKDFPNLEFHVFYKTPNSYQKIDSIEWSISCDIGGFTETAKSEFNFFSQPQIIVISRAKNNVFLYVNKIKLKSGYIVYFPKMQNERFIYERYINHKINYIKLKTFEEAFKFIDKSQYLYLCKNPMLSYKLFK